MFVSIPGSCGQDPDEVDGTVALSFQHMFRGDDQNTTSHVVDGSISRGTGGELLVGTTMCVTKLKHHHVSK